MKEASFMKRFYIGMKDKLLTIAETEAGYDFSTALENLKVNRLAFDPQDERRIYAATDEGLWKTEDNGQNWEQTDDGITSEKITAVAVNPTKQVDGNTVVYAGTEPSHLYYSKDNGKTWTEFKGIQELPSKNDWAFPPRPETHFVRWITPSYSDENYIGVSIEAGAIIYTNDHGKTWNDRPEDSPVDAHTLLEHPDAPTRLYAANGDGTSNRRKAYAESYNGGQSWEFMSQGLEEHPYLYNMVLHPNDPDQRWVSASKSASKSHSSPKYSTIYRKYGQEDWMEIADGLPREEAYSHQLANDPNDIDGIYALNNFGLYRINAKDDHWQEVEIDWPEEYLGERPYDFVVKEIE